MDEIARVIVEALPEIAEIVISLFLAVALSMIRPIRNRLARIISSSASKAGGYKALSEVDTVYHRRIQDTIVELRCRVNAERVSIFQFENGSRFSLSNATWKITQTYETVTDGVLYYEKSIKREPITQMLDMVSPLFDPNRDYDGIDKIQVNVEGAVKRYVFRVDEVRLHSGKLKYEMIRRGTKRAYLLPLKDEQGKLFGICKIAFSHKKQLTEQELLTALSASDKIQAYLNSMFLNSLKQ